MVVLACLGTLVLLALLYARRRRSTAHQPVCIREKVPLVSHILGLSRYGAAYYRKIASRTQLPIFTLRLPFQTFYVVTSPHLITQIHRNPCISFDPLVLLAADRLCGSSKALLDRMRTEWTRGGRSTRDSLMTESRQIAHGYLRAQGSTGPMLDVLMDVTSKEMRKKAEGRVVDLYECARHVVCVASTAAFYGPLNPFERDEMLQQAFWDYDAHLSLLLLKFVPSITARKGVLAQRALRRAFTRFFQNGGCTQASAFVQACHAVNNKHNVSLEDQAGFEVTHCIGLLVNTPPTLFWMLFHVYSDASLLALLRDEVRCCVVSENDSREKNPSIDMTKLQDDCPLLHSTLKEVLRLHASSLSTRLVLQDTSIGNDLVLKKGAIVHMPSACLHHDPRYFGADAHVFNARRFLQPLPPTPLPGVDNASPPWVKPQAAYRPFGGGSTLCPGRHLATAQILGVTAHMLLAYDIEPEGASWKTPRSLQSTMTTTVLPPVDALRVRFVPRRE